MALSPWLSRSDPDLVTRFNSMSVAGDVADLLEIPARQLAFILYEGRHRYPYKEFTIPKRSGGERRIDAPPTSIRILQRKLLRVLGLVVPGHEASHGFTSGRSIVTNAAPHAGKVLVLNADLKDFFPTINFGRVQRIFMADPFGVGYPAATVLAQLCCVNRHLPQGAPTSPMVSNMICYRMDTQLKALAKGLGWFYTRYADDLTFSSWSPNLPAALAQRAGPGSGNVVAGHELTRIIESNWFSLNPAKTRLRTRRERQIVTGLTVNEKPNVRRDFVRTTRAMLHSYRTLGQIASQSKLAHRYAAENRRKVPPIESVIRGRVDYLKMIRGEQDATYLKIAMLAADTLGDRPPPRRFARLAAKTPNRKGVASWREEYVLSLAQLHVTKSDGSVEVGTGWVPAPGLIATAAHVLFEESGDTLTPMKATAVFDDGKEIELDPTRFVAHPEYSSRGIDLAVAFSDNARVRFSRLLPLRLEAVTPHDSVGALGFPTLVMEHPTLTLTQGNIQAVPQDAYGTSWLAVSAELHAGMSGGPVFTPDGGVVGVVSGNRALGDSATDLHPRAGLSEDLAVLLTSVLGA